MEAPQGFYNYPISICTCQKTCAIKLDIPALRQIYRLLKIVAWIHTYSKPLIFRRLQGCPSRGFSSGPRGYNLFWNAKIFQHCTLLVLKWINVEYILVHMQDLRIQYQLHKACNLLISEQGNLGINYEVALFGTAFVIN